MNVSRYSVLAVFFMMVMSAFVALPSYYAGAEHEEDDQPGAMFVYIMTTDRSEAVVNATPLMLEFSANPMAENSPYHLDMICEADEDGWVDGIYATWVTSEGGNAGDFNEITSWSVVNSNGIELEKFYYDPMSDIIDFEDPMIIFKDDEEQSGSGHLLAEVHDMAYFYCDGEEYHNGDDDCVQVSAGAIAPVNGFFTFDSDGTTVYVEEGEEAPEDGIFCPEEGNDCPFDVGPGSPCEPVMSNPCFDGPETPECQDYVMDYCTSNPGDSGCQDWESDGPDIDSWDLSITMESLDKWHVEFSGTLNTGGANEMRQNLAEMCADMFSADPNEITQECFDHWLDMMSDDDYENNMCPPGLTDEQCEQMTECFDTSGPILDCMQMMYNICMDDMSYDFCEGMDDGDMSFFMNIFDYEAAYISAEYFMDELIYMMDGDEDWEQQVSYSIEHFSIEQSGTYILEKDFQHFETPNFICGSDGEEIPFHAVNNGYNDCEDGSDEQQYDSDENPINWFDCHNDDEIWIYQVNDGLWDCADGEDEYRHETWWGDVFLFESTVTADDIINDDWYDGEVFLGRVQHWCDYADNGIEIVCSDMLMVDLDAGDYTTVATSHCYNDWTDEDDDGEDDSDDIECVGGDYTLTLDSYSNEPLVISGMIDESQIMSMPGHYWESTSMEFVMHETHTFTVDESGFTGVFASASARCYEYDEDDNCVWSSGENTAIYLYENEFHPEMPHNILVASSYADEYEWMNKGIYLSDLCDFDYCSYSAFEVDLTEGSYVIVTTSAYTHSEGATYVNAVYDNTGTVLSSWDGTLEPSYVENVESGNTDISAVTTNQNEEGIDIIVEFSEAFETDGEGNDMWIDFHYWQNEYDEWWYLDSTGLDNGDTHSNFTCWGNVWCDEWDGESLLKIKLYVNGNYTTVIWDVNSDELQYQYPVTYYGTDRVHMPSAWEYENHDDDDDQLFMDIMEIVTAYQNGDYEFAEDAANAVIDLIRQADQEGFFNDGNGRWNEYTYCEWEGDDWEGDERWYCTYNTDSTFGFDDWWYYCEIHESMYQCTDDFGQHPEYEYSTDNMHYIEGGRPEPQHHDEEDDNPALLDGIIGVDDSEGEPMFLPDNMIGDVSENANMPVMLGSSFHVSFEGADNSLETHAFYIPIGEDGNTWNVEITLLEGYEVISCEDCNELLIDGNNAKFNADMPVTIIFGMVQEIDTSECDAIVTIAEGGYAFEPADIEISVGETVCWIWEKTADVHNVVEIATKFDADLNLEDAKIGFYSGESATTVDFRHTFTEDDKTHYYVCEPHATMGMVGTVTVGNGTTDDPVENLVEESGLPSVGFVVGVLVLVGAAGLRRRIH